MISQDREFPVALLSSDLHLPDGVSPLESDLLKDVSLPRSWLRTWESNPAAVVVVSADGVKVTAEELEERSAAVAGRLGAVGASPGDRVLLSAEASIDLVAVYVACHRLGAIVVPVNGAYTADEVSYITTNVNPRIGVTDDASMKEKFAISERAPGVIIDPAVSLRDKTTVELDTASASTPCLIAHTSGTTGNAKGAVLTSGNLLASTNALRLAWRWTPDDVLALMLPLYHLHGLGVGLTGSLVVGSRIELLGKFDAERLGKHARRGSTTMFFGVPTMYHRLIESGAAADLGSLRLCVSGSAPLMTETFRRFEELSGHAILERYGMTETVMNVSALYDGPRVPGTVGVPLPGVELRLKSDPSNPDAAEIQLKGPNVFTGYWNNELATKEAFTEDGWFKTGDLGKVSQGGLLEIAGRSKELIITGGFNVYPRDVETVLLEFDGIDDVAVIGEPSEEWGETVAAVIVSSFTVSEDELRLYVAERLVSYKRPRKFYFVEEIPRNSLGKIVRNNVAKLVSG